ncbi:uncharacterized protein LOC122504015 [Leptopilina heterotoma]|uniref:uncharacterized protein LOC122504015 n=1 Tax=Leptopilina heterotoma TaxID=63436 RepID=UPI001CA89755|nr:uncharacterized protein LOC122504015 [Leptopilina heterotoma]
MSKIVLLLCAFLLTGAVYAEQKENHEEENVKLGIVGTVRNEVVAIVELSINQVTTYAYDVLDTTANAIIKLNDQALSMTQSVFYRITDAQQNVRTEVIEALKGVIGGNVTECEQIVDSFDQTATNAREEVKQCIDNVVASANSYRQKMRQSIEVIVKNLTDVKDEAVECVQNINDVRSSVSALYCVNKAAFKGTLTTTKNVPAFWINLGKLSFRVSTLVAEMSLCSAVSEMKTFNAASKTVVQQVRECIKKNF